MWLYQTPVVQAAPKMTKSELIIYTRTVLIYSDLGFIWPGSSEHHLNLLLLETSNTSQD